jgi:hypothetical protein
LSNLRARLDAIILFGNTGASTFCAWICSIGVQLASQKDWKELGAAFALGYGLEISIAVDMGKF